MAFPVLYGGIAFLASLLVAALYNLVASAVGGVRVRLEEERRAPAPCAAPAPPPGS
jgi:hypothetical protein